MNNKNLKNFITERQREIDQLKSTGKKHKNRFIVLVKNPYAVNSVLLK